MSKLLKELCRMSGQLQGIINTTKDEEEKTKLKEKYIELSEQIDIAAGLQFIKNDKLYRDTIKKFKDAEKGFKQFAAHQIEIMDLINEK